MKLDRRQLLKTMAVATGMATAGTLGWLGRLRADTPPAISRKRFVFVELGGAWDTLLGPDPRDPGEFTESNIGETGIQLAYDLLPAPFNTKGLTEVGGITFGPAIPDAFSALAPKMCVGRGFSMDTLSHEVGRLFWSTGRAPSGLNPNAPSIASQIVGQISEHDPDNLGLIPNLSINATVHSFSEDPALRPFQVRNADDMVMALTLGSDLFSKAVLTEIADELWAYRASSQLCDPARLDRYGKMSLVRQSQDKVKEIVESGLADYFMLSQAPLQAHFGYTDANDASALAAVAGQALTLQLSRCVTLRFAETFDDHDGKWKDEQPVDQFAAFTAVERLHAWLAQTPAPEDESKTMADQTVFVIGSDFSRTPILNGTQGRDHWPVNACIFIGGMPAGRVIGASTHYGMESQKIDPESGEAVSPETSGAIALNPGHFMASLMTNEGFSIDDLRESPVPCMSV